MDVPVDLVFVTDHGKNLCHGVVLSFDAVVSAGVVGAGREFVYAEQFIYRCWEQGAKLRSVIGQEGGRAPPERDVAVHQDIGVPSAVNSAAVTANMSARRLKRSVKRRM